MYQSHFCLSGRPFAAAPNPGHYYPTASMERARESLVMSIERAAGAAVVIGAVGTGKTLLCQLVADHFSRDLPVCMLWSTRLCTRRVLLQAVLSQLGLPIQNPDEGELGLTLADHISGSSCPRGILLIVDEADRLPLELLEEIRVITNLAQNGEPRVHLVLTGGLRLEEQLSHPSMESLNQRVVARLYLENFTADETADYIRARITACGGATESLFTEEALRAVFQTTLGVPRLVNQICDHALVLAAAGARDRLDATGIEEAWSDLQQLPLPSRVGTTTAHAEGVANNVVEFGPLEDETDEHDAVSGQPRFDPSGQLDDIYRQVAAIGTEASIARSPAVEPNRAAVGAKGPAMAYAGAEADTANSALSFRDVVGRTDGAGQGTEMDHEEREASTRVPQVQLTIEQATNPFDEDFAEEEVVIRQFAAPNEIARRSEFQVSSSDSRALARKLTAAHPGFRLHPHHDMVEPDDVVTAESEGFQPLTADMHETGDPCAFDVGLDVAKSESKDGVSKQTEHVVVIEPGEDIVIEPAEHVVMEQAEQTEHEVTKQAAQVVTNESAPLPVTGEVHTSRHAESAADGSEVVGAQVVVRFGQHDVDWEDEPVTPDSERVPLEPASNYRSHEFAMIEEPQEELNSPVVLKVPQPGVVAKDQVVSQDVFASAEFNSAAYQQTDADFALRFGPDNAPLAEDFATGGLPQGAYHEREEAKPKVFRRLFSNLRETHSED